MKIKMVSNLDVDSPETELKGEIIVNFPSGLVIAGSKQNQEGTSGCRMANASEVLERGRFLSARTWSAG